MGGMCRRRGSELHLPAATLEMSIWERAAQGRRGEMRQRGGKKGSASRWATAAQSHWGPLRDWMRRPVMYSSGGSEGPCLTDGRLFLRDKLSGIPVRACARGQKRASDGDAGSCRSCRKVTFRASEEMARPRMACTTLFANSRVCLAAGRGAISFMSCGAVWS